MNISDISSFNDLLAHPVVEQLTGYAGNLLSGLVIIILGFWFSGRISSIIRTRLSRIKSVDATLSPVIASVIRYVILLIAFVAGLGSFGI